jgi:hypothetical protein
MIEKFTVPSCGAVIKADTCGTAFQKTIHIKVNCEMDIGGCEAVIASLSRAKEWLEQTPKGCKGCNFEMECVIAGNPEMRLK